jgi:flagellin
MTVINTNISATLASNAIKRNDRDMTTAMERLSTGMRINSAGDDAAGLAIAARMQSQVDGLEQAVRNANDGIAMLQVAEGAVVEISNMLSRMRELAIQAASGTYSATDRAALNLELQQLFLEIQRIAVNTEWNGISILNGDNNAANSTATKTSVTLQIGAGSNQEMVVDLKSWDPRTTFNRADTIVGIGTTANDIAGGTDASAYGSASLVYDAGFVDKVGGTANTRDANEDNIEEAVVTSDSTDTTKDKYIDITTSANAAALVLQIDTAVTAAASERAKLGAYINRLEYAADNLANVAQNTDASRSRIEDADYAEETSELARTQIISQASTAMLAQANQVKQSVLALLQ